MMADRRKKVRTWNENALLASSLSLIIRQNERPMEGQVLIFPEGDSFDESPLCKGLLLWNRNHCGVQEILHSCDLWWSQKLPGVINKWDAIAFQSPDTLDPFAPVPFKLLKRPKGTQQKSISYTPSSLGKFFSLISLLFFFATCFFVSFLIQLFISFLFERLGILFYNALSIHGTIQSFFFWLIILNKNKERVSSFDENKYTYTIHICYIGTYISIEINTYNILKFIIYKYNSLKWVKKLKFFQDSVHCLQTLVNW